MSNSIKLSKDKHGEKVDKKIHQDMIGYLLYLIASESDIYWVLKYMPTSIFPYNFSLESHKTNFKVP